MNKSAALWAVALVGALCSQASAVSAQAMVEANPEPPTLQILLQQASLLEASPESENSTDNAWQAASLYCQAARWGSTEAQYRLAMFYAFGRGVPENRSLAAALFSQAASQGHDQAHQMLETIQLLSSTLPPCVLTAELPEKPPSKPLASAEHDKPQPPIDRLVEALPPNKRWIVELVKTLGDWYAVDHRLLLSVIAVESNFETRARSPKTAMGLMQLIPDTAERFSVRNAFDASQNIKGGIAYLRWLLSYYRGNLTLALAAYNAGEKRVDRHQGVPPIAETRDYVKKVMALYGHLRHSFDADLTSAAVWLRR
ncbi:MAG: transglycosylase SLT domain-containing protein [Burkholderiaceae bacterium]